MYVYIYVCVCVCVYIYIYIYCLNESLCYTAEINIVNQLYFNKTIKKEKDFQKAFHSKYEIITKIHYSTVLKTGVIL